LAGENVWQKWIDEGGEFLQEGRPVNRSLPTESRKRFF
jgi:hypothetical protein